MSEILEQIEKLKAERAGHLDQAAAINALLAQIGDAVSGAVPVKVNPVEPPAKPTRRPRKPKTSPEPPADPPADPVEQTAPHQLPNGRWQNPGSGKTWATEAEARKAGE